MADPYIGQIAIFGFNFAPRGWALCDGALVGIAQNTALFSLLGTLYGGDGKSTFGLPNLQGRAPYHFGNGPSLNPMDIGDKGGSETQKLTLANLAPHTHSVKVECNNSGANKDNPDNNFPAVSEANIYATTKNATMPSIQASNNGGGQAFSIRSPYLALNFCIALQGVFPPRS